MQWYWWVLIAVALVGFVVLKVKVGGAWMRKRKEKEEQRRRTFEEDE